MGKKRAIIIGLVLMLSGCGVHRVEGHYEGTVTGWLTVLGINFPIFGDVGFDLEPAGEDLYEASGDLIVKRKADGQVTYEAILSGEYAMGRLDLTFVSKDGKSDGTMTANHSGSCWRGGKWTISGTGAGGSGDWDACRK